MRVVSRFMRGRLSRNGCGSGRRDLVTGLLALLLMLAAVPPVHAVQPDEVLPDPRLEARARSISAGLRCLVCQNQSIDDSNAPLARDLRLLVRERLTAGDSDKAVVDYVVQRYGEFVLLQPPFNGGTLLLWLAPALLLVGAGILAYRQFQGRNSRPTSGIDAAPLSAEEMRRLDEIVGRRE